MVERIIGLVRTVTGWTRNKNNFESIGEKPADKQYSLGATSCRKSTILGVQSLKLWKNTRAEPSDKSLI